MKDLILTDSFEELKSELGTNLNKMMDFVIPVSDSEKDISIIAKSIKNTGKLVLLYGKPGIGKSTFIQSLKWRPHLPIKEIINIDATQYSSNASKLNAIIDDIRNICSEKKSEINSQEITLLVIDYLESIGNENINDKKAFFRDLNGILRNNKILIVWPMTVDVDIQDVMKHSEAVSGTLFYRNKEIIDFRGPSQEKFADIIKNTISVLNTGYTYNDFQFVDRDFIDITDKLKRHKPNYVLRDYINHIKDLWIEKTGRIENIINSIPKPTEIYFIFSMPEAESLVNQFIRMSKNHYDCFDIYHSRLDGYIHGNQKAAYWTSERLQLAISGPFKSKIFYMPTNTVVSTITAYSESNLDAVVNKLPHQNWKQKSTAERFLNSSPIVKYLKNEQVQMGALKGRAKESVEDARESFYEINAIASKYNPQRDGSDKPFNKSIATALEKVLEDYKIKPEVTHPWLSTIRPDIILETDEKLICLEFCYTKRTIPSTISDYVLNKLDDYMRQLEGMYPDLYK